MKTKYDVVIIGSGIGGLTAGGLLSKAGLKVLIVEKNDRVGGSCVSFVRREFKFDAGAHIIGSCGKRQILGNIMDEIGLNIDFVKFNPMDRIHFPDRRIDIPADINAFVDLLKKEFSAESDSIDLFFKVINRATNSISAASLFKKYQNITFKQILDSFFQNPYLKDILSFGCGYLGLPSTEVSALSMLFLLRSYLVEGAYYPKGGSQVFSNAFLEKIHEYGGEIILKEKVQKIVCEKESVKGVILGENTFVESNYVISNADCKETFYDLLGIEIIKKDKDIVRMLAKYKNSVSFFVVYLALRGGYNLKNRNGWYFRNYKIEHEFNRQVYLHIPTLYDNSIAPKGKQIIEMGTTFPFEFERVNNWEEAKELTAKYSVDLLETMLPGVKKYIEFYDSASPMTIYRYTFNNQGALYGWEQGPAQVFINAFPSSSGVVKNLFLAGHWTFPGGGIVSVAISGMNAAKKILKKEHILED